MRSKVADRILANTPEEVKVFARLYGDLIVRINSILSEKTCTQKSLAGKLEKNPSEIHKWLSGEHNFTLRSIAKLQAALGEILIEVPAEKPAKIFHAHYVKTTYRLTVLRPNVQRKTKVQVWKITTTKKEVSNVG
ncbi:MAG: helix-turn-helix transcriptional regulator [Bacteroidetes bacterium]|nr:helix-turn-helix transcriptional regulator [Bacteroidota bacterium]